jgi:hypothetical protein
MRRRLLAGGLIVGGIAALGALALLLAPWMLLSSGGRTLAAGNADQAAQQLRQAVERLPASVFAWRQLARAERLRGDPAAATAALEQASALAPTDPLVQFELARAYEAAGDPAAADQIWQALGRTEQILIHYADRAFEAERYAAAYQWFDRAVRAGAELDPYQQARFSLAAIFIGADSAAALTAPNAVQPEPIGRIPGARLRWLTAHPRYELAAGAFVTPEAGSSAGVLFWNGAAVAVVDVTQTGRHILRIHARHSRPAPVLLAVGLNDRQLHPIALARDDEQSTTLTMLVDVEQLPQAVTIRFLNDGVVDGIDRNAVIEWIELTPIN